MVSDNARAWQVENHRWLIAVPRELLTVYHRIIGSEAVLLWLHLQCWGERSSVPDIDALVAQLEAQTGFHPEVITLALHRLEQYELVEMKDRVIKLCLPLSADQFAIRFAAELAAGREEQHTEEQEQSLSESVGEISTVGSGLTADAVLDGVLDLDLASAAGAAPVENAKLVDEEPVKEPVVLDKAVFSSAEADLQAVLDLYHKRIGLMGPKQRDKLRFWVEESGMHAEVVAAAIDITARKAENPRIQYLEGVLRNWYNDGVRTFDEALKKYPEIAGEDRSSSASYEGVANAGAYTEADSELIRKWKELYPDEYNS